jgi:predicted CXXCH cytochrome family protein
MIRWPVPGLVALGLLALGGLLASSCSSLTHTAIEPPAIAGASFTGNSGCVDCHEAITRVFPASPHGLFHRDDTLRAGATGCESCHGPGSKHVAAGGGRGKFIVNPGRDASTCFQCHIDVEAQMHLPNHHPVIEGQMSCVQCHDPHGRDALKPAGGLAMARLNESCATCHREQARPFAFEHEALREGCVTCHQPHGSINAKLLPERDNTLCLKCHSQIQFPAGEVFVGKLDHSAFIQGKTCWTAGCHNAVHGSNINPKLQY